MARIPHKIASVLIMSMTVNHCKRLLHTISHSFVFFVVQKNFQRSSWYICAVHPPHLAGISLSLGCDGVLWFPVHSIIRTKTPQSVYMHHHNHTHTHKECSNISKYIYMKKIKVFCCRLEGGPAAENCAQPSKTKFE